MKSSRSPDTLNGTEAVMLEIHTHLRARADESAIIGPDTNITRDLGLDSLAIMDFIFDLEDSFDLSIPMERIAEVQTLADLAKTIEVLQKEAA
jgi:acyl carrier protein